MAGSVYVQREPHIISPGLSSSHFALGSSGLSTVGWLMPSDTFIWTSYTTNQSLSNFIVATLNVFPYQIQPGTTLHLGLYVNGKLEATQVYDLGASSNAHPATSLSNVGSQLRNFTYSMMGFTVSLFPLNSVLPSGTTITVSVSVTNATWVQIENMAGSTQQTVSYELNGFTASTLPTNLPQTAIAAPYTLSVEVNSYAA